MRPQGFGQVGQGLEDLGWDDMGFEPPKAVEAARDASHDAFGDELAEHPRAHPSGLTPVQSPLHSQQAEIAARVAAVEPADDLELDSDDTAEPYQAEPEALVEPQAHADPESETEFDAAPEAPAEAVSVIQVKPAKAQAPVAAALPRAIAPRRDRQPRSAAGSKAKAAFTLRLEPDRHLKLRLACALDGRSAQHLVTDALDQLLAKMPELEAMAVTANRKG